MSAPAFKEWQIIVDALRAGRQTLLLRKGGIAEGPDGFTPHNRRFWLFPTRFHAQHEKTTLAPAPAAPEGEPALQAWAELTAARFVSDWSRIRTLAPHHAWTEAAVREKFDWDTPPGLHVLIVRIHQLTTPIAFTPTPAMAGCKSWIDLPWAIDDHPSSPVLDDAAFKARCAAIHAQLDT